MGDGRKRADRAAGRLGTGAWRGASLRAPLATAVLAVDPDLIAPHDLATLLFGACRVGHQALDLPILFLAQERKAA